MPVRRRVTAGISSRNEDEMVESKLRDTLPLSPFDTGGQTTRKQRRHNLGGVAGITHISVAHYIPHNFGFASFEGSMPLGSLDAPVKDTEYQRHIMN